MPQLHQPLMGQTTNANPFGAQPAPAPNMMALKVLPPPHNLPCLDAELVAQVEGRSAFGLTTASSRVDASGKISVDAADDAIFADALHVKVLALVEKISALPSGRKRLTAGKDGSGKVPSLAVSAVS